MGKFTELSYMPKDQQMKLPFTNVEEVYNFNLGRAIPFRVDPACKSNMLYFLKAEHQIDLLWWDSPRLVGIIKDIK